MLEKGVAPAKRLREKDCEKFYMVRARSSAVEHLTFNQVVGGSTPPGLTNDFNDLLETSPLSACV